MKEITLWLLDKLVSITPSLLLRLIYSPEKLASQIKVNLRSENPIDPSLDASIPHIDIYLEITNLSNFDLILDRMLIDLWFGQPVLVGAILKRTSISSKSIGEKVFFRSSLSNKQVKQIESYLGESPPTGYITLSITAYFVSKIGVVEVEDRHERRKI